MLDFPRWKVLWLWALTIVGMLAAVPSLTATAGLNWPSALPEPKINLGLDLAGGSHILLEADPSQVRQQRIEGWRKASATSCASPVISASATSPTAMAR
jgi:preprotein translocase subunit SecD